MGSIGQASLQIQIFCCQHAPDHMTAKHMLQLRGLCCMRQVGTMSPPVGRLLGSSATNLPSRSRASSLAPGNCWRRDGGLGTF
jgi:hypothetical protein